MKQQNRPHAATDVALNLKGAVTKAAAQKALVALAEQGSLIKKEYGEIRRQHIACKHFLTRCFQLAQARPSSSQ